MGEYKPNDMNMPPESNSGGGGRNESIDKKSLDEMNQHVSVPCSYGVSFTAARRVGGFDVFGCGRRKGVAECTRVKDPNRSVSRVDLLA